jgi:peroxiredoxin
MSKYCLAVFLCWLLIVPALAETAPSFTLPALSGGNFSAAQVFGRKAAIITFFASWSKPCQAELLWLKTLKDNDKLMIIGIALDKKLDQLKTFVNTNAISFPILLDKKLTVLKEYQVLILPTTVVIDQSGNIAKLYVDFDDNIKAAVNQELTRILAPPPDRD